MINARPTRNDGTIEPDPGSDMIHRRREDTHAGRPVDVDPVPTMTGPTRPTRIVDSHVHVFDPDRFPYAADTFYAPAGQELGTPARLTDLLDWHGVEHAVLVGPNSGYGEDNRCLLDALATGAGRYRGMAVVPNDVSRSELAELKDAGVLGVTLNAALFGVDHYADAGRCWPTWWIWT